jgi:periplasmic protein TonB
MNGMSLSRSGLLILITGLHLALLWAMLAAFSSQPIDTPVPYPMVMAEMLPAPQAQPQREQQSEAVLKPAPILKPNPIKQPQPIVKERVKPAPTPVPDTTPSERAIAVPQAASQPAAANTASAAAEPATASAVAEPTGPATAPRFDAAYLNNPKPEYPRLAKRMGEQGRVMLRAHVTPEGMADEVRVHSSSGSSLLDESALQAVRKWKFVPARRGTAAIADWVNVPIDFKLD